MNINELKDWIKKNIPVKYVYISRAPYFIKGSQAYNIYYNSRMPNIKLSLSHIQNQDVFSNMITMGGTVKSVRFERPILIDNYTKPLYANSVFNFIDLAGDFLTKIETPA